MTQSVGSREVVLLSTAPVQNTVQRLADDLFTLRNLVQEFILAKDAKSDMDELTSSTRLARNADDQAIINDPKIRIAIRRRLFVAEDNLRREMGGIPE